MLAAVAAACGATGTGPLPSAGAPRTTSAEADVRSGHGWVVVPCVSSSESVLVHLPPRDDAETARPGTVRGVQAFGDAPVAVAAWDARVWLIFGVETVYGPDPQRPEARVRVRQRPVMSMSAVRSIGGLWEYEPPLHAETMASLPGDAELVSVAGSAAGPVVLMYETVADKAGVWRMSVLTGGRWEDVPLTPSMMLAGNVGRHDAGLVATAEGPALWRRLGPGVHELWTLEQPVRMGQKGAVEGAGANPSEIALPPLAWRSTPRVYGEPGRDWATTSTEGGTPVWCDGQLVWWKQTGDRMDLHAVKPSGVHALAAIGGVGASATVVPIDGVGRLAVVWPTASPGTASEPKSQRGPGVTGESVGLSFTEVSVFTGRVFSTGPARRDGLLSPRDFQIITFIFGALMLVVLLFVLRNDQRPEVVIPTGTALATPGRRVVAGLLDLVPCMLVACWVSGVAPSKVASVAVLLNPGQVAPVIGLGVGLTIVQCVLGEWLAGASVGKRLMGCRVVSLSRAAHGDAVADSVLRVRLWQAAGRNVVRWVMPPLGMLMLFDPAFRHPGDVLSRTVVVMPDEGGEPERDGGA